MLEQVPVKPPYNKNPAGGPEFRDWKHMLTVFDYQLTQGPLWLYNTSGQQGLIGFPFNAFLDWPMGTPAGIYAMLRKDINERLHDMLEEYGKFLKSPKSVAVLNQNTEGWLNEQALTIMTNVAIPDPSTAATKKFWEVYQCDPEKQAFGFKSWDDFFIRKFHKNMRPIYKPTDNQFITNCCESGPYALQTNLKIRDEFWLKGQPYSLEDIMGGPKYAKQYVGGTLYQAFLSALSYHCWHAPVSGKVIDIINIPGSYYAESYWEGFANIGPDGQPDPDPAAPDESQGYICQVAARSVMILEADNKSIGQMAIVVVGMGEVSTTEWYLKIGDHFNKGDLIGTFHFGGSTHCLVFSPNTKLDFVPEATPPYDDSEGDLPVGSLLATVRT